METSCGVVLSNFGSILLLQYPQGHWDFPKGHIEDFDKNRKAAARRELAEETGISSIEFVDGYEGRTEYSFTKKGTLVEKEVWWYVAETDTMDVKISHEHRQYLWLEWEEAHEQLTHDESKEILSQALEHMRSCGKA